MRSTEVYIRERSYFEALAAITAIGFRERPTTIDIRFSQELDDYKAVQNYCKRARLAPLRPTNYNSLWDIVALLPQDWYLYLLPQILFAAISRPEGHVAGMFAHPMYRKISSELSDSERVACEASLSYLFLFEITPELVEQRIARSKRRFARLNGLSEAGVISFFSKDD